MDPDGLRDSEFPEFLRELLGGGTNLDGDVQEVRNTSVLQTVGSTAVSPLDRMAIRGNK